MESGSWTVIAFSCVITVPIRNQHIVPKTRTQIFLKITSRQKSMHTFVKRSLLGERIVDMRGRKMREDRVKSNQNAKCMIHMYGTVKIQILFFKKKMQCEIYWHAH